MRFAGHAAVGWGVGGFILGSFAAPGPAPTVSLVGASPVVVAGSGLTPGARVLVTYRSGLSLLRRRVTVTIGGRFRLVLAGVAFARCDGLRLVAGPAVLRVPSCAAGGKPAVSAEPGGLVSGSAFVPGERVAVSARRGDLVVRRSTTAGHRGTFSTRLALPRTACTDIDVRAVGALGSRASTTVTMPDCRTP